MVKRELTVLAITALIALSGCAKKDVTLPGERENIWAIVNEDEGIETPEDAAVQRAQNRALPISLPAAQRNANWLQSAGSPFVRTAHPALGRAPKQIWSVNIGHGDGARNRITADPVVAGDRIFTLDATATVTAVSANGQALWSKDLTPPYENRKDASGGGLAYADNLLYVTSGFGLLTALNPTDGSVVWQQNLRTTGTGAPTVRDGIVYLVSGDELAWAVDAKSGRIHWQLSSAPDINNVLGAPAPVIDDKYVIFGFGPGELQGAFRKGGLRMWDAVIAGERPGIAGSLVSDVTGYPVINRNHVYVGTNSGRIAALSVTSGERIWTTNEGVLSAIWPAGGSLFFVSDRNRLIRLSESTGEVIWSVDLPFFTKTKPHRQSEIYQHNGPVVAGGQVVVASGDGHLRFFDPISGRLAYATEISGGATTNPVVAGGTLYVVSSKGMLVAYR